MAFIAGRWLEYRKSLILRHFPGWWKCVDPLSKMTSRIFASDNYYSARDNQNISGTRIFAGTLVPEVTLSIALRRLTKKWST